MERRKFLASLVGLGTIAVISPQLLITKKKKFKEEDIFSKFDISDENSIGDCVVGYVTLIDGKEVIIRPFSVVEEFPALKKGDQGIIISNTFPEVKLCPYEEEDLLHKIITVGEDIPAMGPGNDMVLWLGEDEKYFSICKQLNFNPKQMKLRLNDVVLFPKKS